MQRGLLFYAAASCRLLAANCQLAYSLLWQPLGDYRWTIGRLTPSHLSTKVPCNSSYAQPHARLNSEGDTFGVLRLLLFLSAMRATARLPSRCYNSLNQVQSRLVNPEKLYAPHLAILWPLQAWMTILSPSFSTVSRPVTM